MSDDPPNVLRTPIDQPLFPLDDEERHAVVALLGKVSQDERDGRLPVTARPLPQLLERIIEESAAAYRARTSRAASDAEPAASAPAILNLVAERLGVTEQGDVLDALDATIQRAARADDGNEGGMGGQIEAYAKIHSALSAATGRCLTPDDVVSEFTRLTSDLDRRLGALETQLDRLGALETQLYAVQRSGIPEFRKGLLEETASRLVQRLFPSGDD